MSEIEEIPEIQEIQEIEEIEEMEEIEEEPPKKKAGRPKGSKNVAKAKAEPKKPPTPVEPPVKKSKIVKESTKPPVKYVHRKSRTRVIVLSSSSESDHKIRVVRKPAKPIRYEYSSDSDAPPVKSAPAPAPAPTPAPAPMEPRPTSTNPANRFAFDIQADHQLRAAATKRTYDSFFSHLR